MKNVVAYIFFSLFPLISLIANSLPKEAQSFCWDKPHIEKNQFRRNICLNGYWRFLPLSGSENNKEIPQDNADWGWFKVPGVWPQFYSKANPFQPFISEEKLRNVKKWHSAWYNREFSIPDDCKGNRIFLDIEHIQTRAVVYINGKKVGGIVFPGGMLDITDSISFGKKQKLSVFVSAIPSSSTDYIIMDTHNVFKVAAKVKIKGIVGDVFIRTEPDQCIQDTHFITSTRNKSISFDCGLKGLMSGVKYNIKAEVMKGNKIVKTFKSESFNAYELKAGRYCLTQKWNNPELWDLDSPQNIYHGIISLVSNGKTIDKSLPEKFGFREFWIEGQNYMLNGSPVHLMAYHLGTYSNFWAGDKSDKKSCMKTFERLKKLGFNFFITSNYNFSEGNTSYIRGTYEVADKSGILSSFSLPHPRHFNWELNKPQVLEKYKKITSYLIKKYWNHPSLIMFASTHNTTSAWGDQNPLRLGLEYKPASSQKEREKKEPNRKNAQIVMECANRIDPSRPVYVHASGNLCGNYTLNMYLNWAPLQERSDWLENYFHNGRYPLALVEWGLPHIASFSSFRGPGFIWNTAARQTVWDIEYIAAYNGDASVKWTSARKKLLDKLIKLGNEPFRWGKIYRYLKKQKDIVKLQARFYYDNLRSMRAWNISMLLPWDDYANYVKVPGNYKPVENDKRFNGINRPGIVPDYYRHDGYVYSPYENSYKLSKLGEVIRRWNRPLIAFIGGEKVFTSKEHVYYPGTDILKNLVILNDKRKLVKCKYEIWGKNIMSRSAKGEVSIAPGTRCFVPVKLKLPENTSPGRYLLQAKFNFSDGSRRWDQFNIEVIKKTKAVLSRKVEFALYDPKGLSAKYLDKLGVKYRKVTLADDCSQYKTLLIGRQALSATGKLPDLREVKSGQNVLIFEQSSAVLNRLGFRTNEHGLRFLYIRDKKHPSLKNMTNSLFSNWRGESTLLPPYLDYKDFFAPEWKWCGFKNTRVWRSSNRGNLASVLIEKPPIGNFKPLLDGGFALQYSPLMEYSEGQGKIIFCQLDVTSRSLNEPVADVITGKLLEYISAPRRNYYKPLYLYSGNDFSSFISQLNIRHNENTAVEKIPDNTPSIILAGPKLDKYPNVSDLVKAGNVLVCVGLDNIVLEQLCPDLKDIVARENAVSAPVDLSSDEFSGISNLDTYFQTRLNYSVIGKQGTQLQQISYSKGKIIICSVAPEELDYKKLFRLRSSYRRRVFLVSRLLHNLGATGDSILLNRFSEKPKDKPWLNSFYIQKPIAEDDPYRYYHW